MSALSPGLKAASVFLALSAAFCAAITAAQNPSASAPETEPAPQGFKISGTVVNAITGAPLARVHVSIADTRARMQRIEIVTGEDGHFEFSPLPAAKYALQGTKRGYITAGYDQHEQYATAIVTGPEFATDKLIFRLMPMAVISGHVLDESGEPVRSARISLFAEDHSAGMNRIHGMNSVMADDRGYFEFSLLPPGTYFVSANAKPWYAVYPNAQRGNEATQKIPPELNVAYPTTYYGGATDSEGAAPLALKGGEHKEIDIRLVPVPALRLVFHVPVEQPDEGQPTRYFANVVLRKHMFDSPEYTPQQTQMVEPGVFEITGVPAGRYDVSINIPSGQGMQQLGEMNLTRDGQDLGTTEGQALATLKVQLRTAEDEPLPKQYFVALRDSRQRIVAGLRGDVSGAVTVEAIHPGKYGIVVFPMGPGKRYSVIHLSSGTTALPGREVDLHPGASLELTADLAAGEERIDGVVQKNGKPLAGVMVALVPNDPEANVDLFRRDQSDFDGTFSLQGVIPGNYTVVAVEDAWGFEWLKAGVLARYVQHGQQVIIGEKMRGTLHLPEPVEVQSK
jgi:Carboxypeptidase regulatory-like domain